MRNRILTWVAVNKKAIIITFEVFWILIFVLDRLTTANSAQIPQFVYVNF